LGITDFGLLELGLAQFDNRAEAQVVAHLGQIWRRASFVRTSRGYAVAAVSDNAIA
jgi:hypothetical protein